MKKWLTITCLLASYIGFSQTDSASIRFVYLYSGEKIKSDVVEFRDQFMGSGYFFVGKEQYSADLVKFYKDANGFYANTKKLNVTGKSVFSKRIISGRVNLFEQEKMYTTPSYLDAAGVYNPGTSSKTIKNYYNKGFSDLKKANYKNLKIDLADSPESMGYIKKYRKYKNVQIALSIVGGALVATGVTSYFVKTSNVDRNVPNYKEPNTTPSMLIALAGGGLIGFSYYLSFPKRDKLKKAIDAYNW